MTSPSDAVPRVQPSAEPTGPSRQPAVDRASSIPAPLLIWGPVVLWMAVIFLFSARDGLDTGSGRLRFELAKLAHLSVYLILGALLMRAMTTVRVRRRAWWVLVILVLYAISDETHQAFVPGRTPLLIDLAIDAAGGLAGLTLWHQRLAPWFRRRGLLWAVPLAPVSGSRAGSRGTGRARR